MLEKHLVALISEVSGGPHKYMGRDLKKVHEGMQITDEEFNALGGHLAVTLKMHTVPQEAADALLAEVAKLRPLLTDAKPPAVAGDELWKKLGGEEGVKKIVHDFIVLAQKDPKVNLDRGGTLKLEAQDLEKVEKHLVELISEATGGPQKYTGKDIKMLLAELKPTPDELNAVGNSLAQAMTNNKVPNDVGSMVFTNLDKVLKVKTNM
jgi:hemoglobin